MAQYDPTAVKSGIPTIFGIDTVRADRESAAGLTTAALASGDACQVNGALTMQKALNTSTSPIVGIYEGTSGSVVRSGVVVATMKAGVVLANGDTVYLSSTAGALTNVKPTADMLHEVGVVVSAAASNILLQPKPVIVLPVTPPVYVWASFTGGGAAKFAAADGSYVTRRTTGSGTEGHSVMYDGTSIWTTDQSSLYKTALDGSSGGDFAITVNAYQMTFDGTDLWVPAYSSAEIRRVNTAGAVVASYAAGTSWPSYACYGGGFVWLTNQSDNSVRKINPATGGIVGAYATGRSNVRGLTTDGTYMYVACTDGVNNGRVVRIRISDGAATADWATGGLLPEGVTFDGANAWTINRDGYSISKIRISDGTLFGPYGLSAGGWGDGIAFDGTCIWAAVRSRSTIQKFSTDGVFIGEYGSAATIPTPFSICTTYRVGVP